MYIYTRTHQNQHAHRRKLIQESIDAEQLEWCRRSLHATMDAEALRVGGPERLALIGESQGACVALDAALTYAGVIGGVFSSFGMLLSPTPAPRERAALRVGAFHGAADCCIGAGLALRSYGRLLEAGFTDLRLHVEPGLGHVERSRPPVDAEMACIARALRAWGLVAIGGAAAGGAGAPQKRPNAHKSRAAPATTAEGLSRVLQQKLRLSGAEAEGEGSGGPQPPRDRAAVATGPGHDGGGAAPRKPRVRTKRGRGGRGGRGGGGRGGDGGGGGGLAAASSML